MVNLSRICQKKKAESAASRSVAARRDVIYLIDHPENRIDEDGLRLKQVGPQNLYSQPLSIRLPVNFPQYCVKPPCNKAIIPAAFFRALRKIRSKSGWFRL
jgi:hypothetical protein